VIIASVTAHGASRSFSTGTSMAIAPHEAAMDVAAHHVSMVAAIISGRKYFVDVVVMTDSVVLGVEKAISDTVAMSDAVVIGVGKTVSDTVTMGDVSSLGIGKTLTDSVTMSDSFSYLLTTRQVNGAMVNEFQVN
jgi:hypothetical protein